MANVKNITDLPLAESAEGLNLIVNDGGSAKQIAASAVGAQADWAEIDENSPAFVKNKPEVSEKPFNIDRELIMTLTRDDFDNEGFYTQETPLTILNGSFDDFYYEIKFVEWGMDRVYIKTYDGNAGGVLGNDNEITSWWGKYAAFYNRPEGFEIELYLDGLENMNMNDGDGFISLSIYREKSNLIPCDAVVLNGAFDMIYSIVSPLENEVRIINNKIPRGVRVEADANINLSGLEVGNSISQTYTKENRCCIYTIDQRGNGNYYTNAFPESENNLVDVFGAYIRCDLQNEDGQFATKIHVNNGTFIYEFDRDDDGNIIVDDESGKYVTTRYQYQLYGTIVDKARLYIASMICNEPTSATLTITRVV